MAGTKNLTPFKKGDNRASEAGKKSKRGPGLKNRIKLMLETDAPKSWLIECSDPEAKSIADVLAAKLLEKAKEGDAPSMKLVLEHMEGKPAQTLDLTSDNVHRIDWGEIDEEEHP